MKLVLDTNVLIAAFISHGTCNELFEHCGIHHEIILSAFILDELAAKLTGKFKYTQLDAESVVALVKSRSRILRALPSIPPTCRDPEDDNIIATALENVPVSSLATRTCLILNVPATSGLSPQRPSGNLRRQRASEGLAARPRF